MPALTQIEKSPIFMANPTKLIDPITFRESIRKNVYDEAANRRMVYKIRRSGSYNGAVSVYLGGCSYRCDYCYVHTDWLSGGGRLVRKNAGRKNFFMTPEELFAVVRKRMEEWRIPQIQFTGGETFLTPRWTADFIALAARYFESGSYPHPIPKAYGSGAIWVDSQGFDLLQHQELLPELASYHKYLRIFISAKAHPDDFAQRTGVNPGHADDAFLALEQAWKHGIVAMPQMIDNLFYPKKMDWLFDRLSRIHPQAPRVVEIDRLQLYAWKESTKNIQRMQKRGFQFGKGGDIVRRKIAIDSWNALLEKRLGKGQAMTDYADFFDVDQCPWLGAQLVEKLILRDFKRASRAS